MRQPGSVWPTSADVLVAKRRSAQGQTTFGKALGFSINPSQRVCAFGLRHLRRHAAPKAVYLMNGMQQHVKMPEQTREVCVSNIVRRSVLMAGCSRPNKGRGFTTVASGFG